MKKFKTYFWYLMGYLQYGDFISVVASVKYLLFKKSNRNDRIIQTRIGKFYCRKNTNDFQFANYRYEWGVKKYILDHIMQYSVFIDAGACIGDYCILLSKFGLKCYAIEPITDNYTVLRKNIKLNNLTNQVMTFPVGLGNENTLVNFKFNPVNTGASHVDRLNTTGNCMVEIRTFDSMLDELKIDTSESILFKLDVEGMEIEALQGSVEFIRKYPNITFVMEDKHSGQDLIKAILDKVAVFEYGIVDEFNTYAHKIGNLK